MQEIKSFPIFYPPDGLYYIFSKEYGQFWRQRGAVDGGMIDCIPLGHAKEGVSLDNRIWKVTTVRPATVKYGPRVTLQCASATHDDAAEDTFGFVSRKGSKVIQSATRKMSWTLIGHGNKPFAYKIVTTDLRVSINAPMHSILYPKTELRAEFHVTSAYDMRVYDPQWWYFVPVDQIDSFLSSNGIQRSSN